MKILYFYKMVGTQSTYNSNRNISMSGSYASVPIVTTENFEAAYAELEAEFKRRFEGVTNITLDALNRL